MEGVWFLERHTERDKIKGQRHHKRGLMCWSHTSSPSLRTMVPARSTTAKTMTAQSSLLTDIVMLANAGSWCMNSSNCSVRGTEERQQRRWERLRENRAERVLTHRRDRQRCSWQASFSLTSSQDSTSWRLGIKMDNHHSEVPTEESLSGEHKAEYQPHFFQAFKASRELLLTLHSVTSVWVHCRHWHWIHSQCFVKHEPVNRISSASWWKKEMLNVQDRMIVLLYGSNGIFCLFSSPPFHWGGCRRFRVGTFKILEVFFWLGVSARETLCIIQDIMQHPTLRSSVPIYPPSSLTVWLTCAWHDNSVVCEAGEALKV